MASHYNKKEQLQAFSCLSFIYIYHMSVVVITFLDVRNECLQPALLSDHII